MKSFPILIVGCSPREEQLLRAAMTDTAQHADALVTRTGSLAVRYLATTAGNGCHHLPVIVLFLNDFVGPALEVVRWLCEQSTHERPPVFAIAEAISEPQKNFLAGSGVLRHYVATPVDWPDLVRRIASHRDNVDPVSQAGLRFD